MRLVFPARVAIPLHVTVDLLPNSLSHTASVPVRLPVEIWHLS